MIQGFGTEWSREDREKMAEVTISPDEIRDALKDFVKSYRPSKTATTEVGYVVDAADGIAHVEGLPGVMANELIRFGDGTLGLALSLDENEIGVVVLGEFGGIVEGLEVARTGEVLSVPVGDNYLGRVVDPLGNPLDGLGVDRAGGPTGPRAAGARRHAASERQGADADRHQGHRRDDPDRPRTASAHHRRPPDRQDGHRDRHDHQPEGELGVRRPEQAGALHLRRDRPEGLDHRRHQGRPRGRRRDGVHDDRRGSPASDPAGFKYLAPYTGSAIGQHWMYAGKHVLIVFDDLSKQAEAYRAVSLLLRRPPGREAYPGDVFYLHSRLLERCAKLSDELGAGSMTGLPIIETKANDVSAYIPTNVISITDGQIFLQSDLFNANQRPAVDVGISVSRVGGDAQVKSIKKVSGTLKLELAQYRSLEAFAMFASDLDAASRRQLARGARLTELLKQPQYSPYPVEEQVVSIWAGTNGKLDEVPVEDILRFEHELLDYLGRNTEVLDHAARHQRARRRHRRRARRCRSTSSSSSSRPARASRSRRSGKEVFEATAGRRRQPGEDRPAEALDALERRRPTSRYD